MEKRELVPNNTTLAGLRGLLREARKNIEEKEAVYIDLMLWDYGRDVSDSSDGRIVETIGVYRSGTGKGTTNFKTLKKARDFIEGWRKEETDDPN